MATLTGAELSRVRNYLEKSGEVVYTKPQINAAIQAIEDWMTSRTIAGGDVGSTVPQLLSAVINTATSPVVLSNNIKKILFAMWAESKFLRDK